MFSLIICTSVGGAGSRDGGVGGIGAASVGTSLGLVVVIWIGESVFSFSSFSFSFYNRVSNEKERGRSTHPVL